MVSDTLYVDVMLTGNMNYTQLLAEIAFDSDLLKYEGYENLNGWVASCAPAAAGKILLRSVPSSNMMIGTPCSPAVRVVTLKFTVKDGFAGEAVDTNLSFSSITVSPPGGVVGVTTAPGKVVSIKVQK